MLAHETIRVSILLHPNQQHNSYLIGCNCHMHLIPDAQQQQATLCTVYGDFPDKLIKALSIELLSDRTYPSFSCLQRHALVILVPT